MHKHRGIVNLCRYRAVVLAMTGAMAGPAAAGAQVPKACQRLDTLRDSPLTGSDDQLLDACVTAELSALDQAIKQSAPDAAMEAFRTHLLDQAHNAKNKQEFTDRFIERTAQVFAPRLASADTDPLLARSMAGVLLAFDAVQARAALVAGLKSPDATVRYVCAKSLVQLRDAIGADARVARATITALKDACAQERSGVVAGVMYQAMNYAQHPDESTSAMLAALTGRVNRLKQPGVILDRGELPVLAVFAQMSSNLGPVANDLVRQLATLLRIHVEHYKPKALDLYQRAAIEETIIETESLLKKIVRGSKLPDVTGKMQRGGDTAAIDMQIELNRWIGVDQTDGVLNAAPYNVPRGAP